MASSEKSLLETGMKLLGGSWVWKLALRSGMGMELFSTWGRA